MLDEENAHRDVIRLGMMAHTRNLNSHRPRLEDNELEASLNYRIILNF